MFVCFVFAAAMAKWSLYVKNIPVYRPNRYRPKFRICNNKVTLQQVIYSLLT